MNLLTGLTLLLVYQLIGEVCVLLLKLPLPGPVLGMALLFLTLLVRGKAGKSLESASSSLLSHLSLLFVPAGVGLMIYFDRIAQEWIAITVTLLLSTIMTLLTTAGIMLLASRLINGSRRSDIHG
jgi:holin-like protein